MKLDIFLVLLVFGLFSYVQSPSPNPKVNREPNTKPGRANKGPLPKLPKYYKKHSGMKEKWWKEVVKNIKKIKRLAAEKWNRKVPLVLEDTVLLGDVAITPPQSEKYLARLTKKKTKGRRKRKVISFTSGGGGPKKWTLPIAYKINPADFTVTQQHRIHQAMYHLHAKTCLRFQFYQAYEAIDTNHILFMKSQDCWSYLGKVDEAYLNGPQPINLNDECANWIGSVIHEVGHAVGLIHEHQRPDRNNFVSINTDNIKSTDLAQFTKYDPNDVLFVNDITYDFKSVMQYAAWAYARPDRIYFGPVIRPHEALFIQEMGQPTRASYRDIQAINYIYCSKCSAMYSTCQRGGYLKPPMCSTCNCPSGFAGTNCEQLAPGYGSCSPSTSGIIQVTDRVHWNCLESPNYGTGQAYPFGTECNWLLKAPSDSDKIEARFEGEFGIPCRDFWSNNFEGSVCVHWVEIRRGKPIMNKGARFCCSHRPSMTIESAGEMMVLFDSKYRAIPALAIPNLSSMYMKGFKLCYKLVDSSSDPCAAKPCLNQGVCIVWGIHFYCHCTPEYAGQYCEQKKACSSNPCLNGGTCYENPDSYICSCYQRYYGTRCENNFY